jgi:RNA polymerase sigma-70 factor (ECF subfamily)
MEGKGTLIERALKGETGAIDRLYDRYYTIVRRMTHSLDPAAPEDKVHVVLIKVLQLLKDPDREFDGDFRNKFTGWLFRVARNVLFDDRRKRGEKGQVSLDNGGPEAAAKIKSPSQVAIQEELETLLREQIESLPPLYRDVLQPYFFEGKSTKEIADDLELDELAVRKRMSRAYDRLRSHLRGVATTLYRARPSR